MIDWLQRRSVDWWHVRAWVGRGKERAKQKGGWHAMSSNEYPSPRLELLHPGELVRDRDFWDAVTGAICFLASAPTRGHLQQVTRRKLQL